MTAIIDRAAALGRIVDGAEELPLARAHFGACVCTAWRSIEQKAYDKAVALSDQEAAEFIEPKCLIGSGRWCRQHLCCFAGHRGGIADRMVVVKSCKMFLKLKCRVELFRETNISVYGLCDGAQDSDCKPLVKGRAVVRLPYQKTWCPDGYGASSSRPWLFARSVGLDERRSGPSTAT